MKKYHHFKKEQILATLGKILRETPSRQNLQSRAQVFFPVMHARIKSVHRPTSTIRAFNLVYSTTYTQLF